MRVVLFLVAFSLYLHAQQPSAAPPNVKRFLPADANLIKQLDADFENDGRSEIVLAYASDRNTWPGVATGVRILKSNQDSRWTVAFEQKDFVTNGGGWVDAIDIRKVKAATGEEAVVVILKFSGAGTATFWHLLASVNDRFTKLDATRERGGVLKRLGYQDWGYNSVATKGPFVIETQAGYSKETARCCPDRPSVEMLFRFTANAIIFDSLRRLPFKPTKY